MAMEPIPFPASSNIKGVEYDPDTQTMVVQYSRGHIYRYSPVTGEQAAGLAEAKSATEYIRTFVSDEAVEVRIE